jgi:hypothetical protein
LAHKQNKHPETPDRSVSYADQQSRVH